MLKSLHIRNYAIIDELTIDFSPQLNAITGETGAGKSILMGALSLILGDRADTSVLLNRNQKCVVEGLFPVKEKTRLHSLLNELDLDEQDELLIRREISTNGKSRAFVNDTPVNLDQLRKISSVLVDLHRQFDTLTLGESGFQRDVLDALAGQLKDVEQYNKLYIRLTETQKALAVLYDQKTSFAREYDYHKFLFDELNELSFAPQELELLENEAKVLSGSEEIKQALTQAVFVLKENENHTIQQVKSTVHTLQPYASLFQQLPELVNRLQSAQVEIQDIAADLEHLNDHLQHDPVRMEEIQNRLSEGYRLLKKHGVKTTDQLLTVRDQLQQKLKAVLDIDETIRLKEIESDKLREEAAGIAKGISLKRQKEAKPLVEKIDKLLAQVGMPNARLRVNVRPGELRYSGADEIDFLFDGNKSDRFEPIGKVASGGELSRLMLCIKSLVAQSINLPTLIFDEIDTGISGEAARQVGIILKGLSTARQVICITHQPQIAGKADAHYFVFKEIRGDAVKTNIRQLTGDERITAIAKMLSGEKPTAAALENAREMVMN